MAAVGLRLTDDVDVGPELLDGERKWISAAVPMMPTKPIRPIGGLLRLGAEPVAEGGGEPGVVVGGTTVVSCLPQLPQLNQPCFDSCGWMRFR